MEDLSLLLTVWTTACAALLGADAPRQPVVINSFESTADLSVLVPGNARIQPVTQHVTHGRQSLEVQFQPAEWPQVRMMAPAPWNWKDSGGLVLDITNPGRSPVRFGVRVDDAPMPTDPKRWWQGQGWIAPGARASFVLPFNPDPMSRGMRGLPVTAGLQLLSVGGSPTVDLSRITAFQVFLHQPAEPTTLILDHVRVQDWAGPLEGIVDAFGQYARATWPGKLADASELAARRQAEAADLAANPAPDGLDRFGGCLAGPALKATGFFRVERVDGRWWLVTPEGHVFFSLGMDCVSHYEGTITTGREELFTWLPGEGDPLARHAGTVTAVIRGPVRQGRTFNFFAANLERKYGPDWLAAWHDVTLRRLPSWGFNTIANWSDHGLYGNGRVPYVATVHVGGDHARVSSGVDYWGRMHDPFDPRFAGHAEAAVREIAAKVGDDPWCVGYFVDNELSWGGFGDQAGRTGLALGALAEPADTSPAKRAMLEQLRTKYGRIEDLNAAWRTSLTGWDALRPAWKPDGPPAEAMQADLRDFVRALARRYFETVRDALRRFAPNHLYLGCRFAWRTEEAVEAAAGLCDVVSFNIYEEKPDPVRWGFVRDMDRPCIIGEFHFGALDRGMFHAGLVAAPDQAGRAAMYADYVRSILDHPSFVGCHWFQYVDQPLTGRVYDGENYNIGFLDVTDTPYPEMVRAARQVRAEVCSRRLAAGK